MSPTSRESVNPYAPPKAGFSPAPTFRISSLLLVIAVIAVCLGVAHENLVLGIIVAIFVVPALVLGCTFIVVSERKAAGRSMAFLDGVGTFLGAFAGVVIIAFSALVAFCMTCFPIGEAAFAANSITGVILAAVIGGLAAVAAAYATHLLLYSKGRRTEISGKP